jgi:hypothetical protein
VLFIALVCFVCLNNGVVVVVDMVIPPISTCCRNKLIPVLLGPANHVDCLLYGAYSHRNL